MESKMTSASKAAWEVLMMDSSWISAGDKDEWIKSTGAYDPEALDYITDKEIQELQSLLAVFPFRKFQKLMEKKYGKTKLETEFKFKK